MTDRLALIAVLIAGMVLGARYFLPLGLGFGCGGTRSDFAQAEISQHGNIAKALERFKFESGRYPEKIEDLYRKPSYIEDESEGKPLWNGPYMDGEPAELKDPWGNQFNYNGEGQYNEGKYDLWSSGKNGKDERGSGDDIKNWRDK